MVTCLASANHARAGTAYFDFGSGSATANPTEGAGPNLTVGAFSIGNPNNPVSSPANTTSASSTYSTGYAAHPGASGSGNFSNIVKTGDLSTATSSYFEVTLTPTSEDVRVIISDFDFGARSTATGPTSYALYNSTDSYANAAFTAAVPTTSAWVFRDNTITTPITGASGVAVTLRLFTYGGTGNATTTNSRIDDVFITAVPEPASLGLLGLLGWGLARRRSRT